MSTEREENVRKNAGEAAGTGSARVEEAGRGQDRLRKAVFAGVFAALTFIVFTFLSIRIPTPGGGQVSVQLGNVFVVLGALFLGGYYGGIAGALGLTIADLVDPAYIAEAPITFIIKLLLGLIVGVIAHRLGHITRESDKGKVMRWVIIASAAGLLYNVVFDPTLRYFYKILILGKPMAEVSFAINFAVTLVNAAASLVVVILLYWALRVPLRRAGLFFRL
ncbi:ECF transporter S component [Lachnoclostridium sp. Marseille-P6806]|uniref:ECF transporter S component n=1 Tax=Lachnoclostridium sp. Marseille-P6806 TaxID=2364793 RepID=UPI0010320F17|nr:ECF transporter S component [Lachnoclostridium sp. Marseille-P6806]